MRVAAVVALYCLCATLFWWSPAAAQSPTRTPPMGPDLERLQPPPMPEHPSQADEGAYEFYLRCEACHGDRGQGLTEEWRAAWGPEEQNCWQAKCHAGPLPPNSFELPRQAPALIGDQRLTRFETAADLQHFICEQMPWHAPGTLEQEVCWQLAAFLVRENDFAGERHLPLGPENGTALRLGRPEPASPPPAGHPPLVWLFLVAAAAILVFALWRYQRRRQAGSSP